MVKYYGMCCVFDVVSFWVVVGECVVLMGFLGSGKMMLFNCFGGVDWLDVGDIMLYGWLIVNFDGNEFVWLWCEWVGMVF